MVSLPLEPATVKPIGIPGMSLFGEVAVAAGRLPAVNGSPFGCFSACIQRRGMMREPWSRP